MTVRSTSVPSQIGDWINKRTPCRLMFSDTAVRSLEGLLFSLSDTGRQRS
jgi:hypothetical protein